MSINIRFYDSGKRKFAACYNILKGFIAGFFAATALPGRYQFAFLGIKLSFLEDNPFVMVVFTQCIS
jgi:hypothetical protein